MSFAYLVAAVVASVLQPSTKWVVDFADNACVLSRGYGIGEQAFNVHFKAAMIGPGYEIVVADHEMKSSPEASAEGWIERPDGSKAAVLYINSYSTVSKLRLSRMLVDPDKYVIGEDGERIILQLGKARRLDLALPGFKNALAVMETCQKGLRKDHGVDEQVMARIATQAKARRPAVSYFSTDDYPQVSVRAGAQGNVGILFWVETNGRVKECKAIETSNRPALDAQTCAVVVKRARFHPALDGDGQPIRSPQYMRIRWRMPG